MKDTQSYIHTNQQRFLEELKDWLRIPSVSADPVHREDVSKAAEFLADKLRGAGLDAVEICPTQGHPIVYAEKMIDPSLPVILVYGHYDVQPPDPLDLWESPPFEPIVKKTAAHPDGALFARGACDDKGQAFMHVKSLEAMLSQGELPCNVKIMMEGEEEVGSVNLGDFCRDNREKLACDMVLVSDTSMIANDVPSITVGLRGLSYVEVEVTGPNRDLHSGVYGGAVGNPVNILCEMISSLIDEDGHITIEGFYDDVETVSDTDRKAMKKAPFNLEEYASDLDIGAVQGEKGYTTLERTTIRPTLDVNGIWGGYTGEGAKTVLPSKAYAKISMRLVPNQDSETITRLFEAHFTRIAPPSVKIKVTAMHGGEPVVISTDSVEYRSASKAMQETFGKEPIPMRSGGSIPIVALFEEVLGVKTVLLGFGLDSDAIHSPNEHFGLVNYYKGIQTIPWFYHFYALDKRSEG